MSSAASEYRLDGIYKQRQSGFFMQRIKLAAGVISSAQARAVSDVAEQYGKNSLHLTSRGSIEIHWLCEHDLVSVKRELAKVGLTSRGACGGAVRGITCDSLGSAASSAIESLSHRLHRHFTGNPRFERLPKKFKIGIETDVAGGRHLIQDAGLVLARQEGGHAWYDIWIAGGLGRAPRPGFLLSEAVPEERIIPIIETILNVYSGNVPPGKRLKHLASEIGEERLRTLIENHPGYNEELPPVTGLPDVVTLTSSASRQVVIPIFAGAITADQFRGIASIAERHAGGVFVISANQDIALLLDPSADHAAMYEELALSGIPSAADGGLTLRVCPGSHECIMGLAPTRDVAERLAAILPEKSHRMVWAISGCPNSCTRPQLADVGIVASRQATGSGGERTPRYDIYRRTEDGFGKTIYEGLDCADLLSVIPGI